MDHKPATKPGFNSGPNFIQVTMATWQRDVTALYRFVRAQIFLRIAKHRNLTVAQLFEEIAAQQPNSIAIHYKEDAWTFAQLSEYSNQVANALAKMGHVKGEEIALMMNGRPEFIGIWLGAAKLGLVTALINTNQRQEVLIHSLTTIQTQAVIFGVEYLQAIKEVMNDMSAKCPKLGYYCYGYFEANEADRFTRFDELIKESSTTLDLERQASGNFTDTLMYIYTSGTTGLPKPATIKNYRYMQLAATCRYMTALKNTDVIYDPLPLYHSAGGVAGVGQCLLFGNTIAVRSKFSASNFWTDCIKYNCTAAQYIGEMCRYLLTQPERATDKEHNVRLIFGNGVRAQIWNEFVQRFNIDNVREFYASTEGNVSLINVDNRVGSCGFISQIAPSFYPVTLIKVDPETKEIARDKYGVCIRAKPGEIGEVVGKIVPYNPSRAFDGYVSREASEKKIIRDVFGKGDMAFRSGDLMVMDDYGYLYFHDRIGDTFRWKGENVSTQEIENVIGKIIEHTDCVGYGVEVPRCEGRCGMIAIYDPEGKIKMNLLAEMLPKKLPLYAIPYFVRFLDAVDMTSTFKFPKNRLQAEGFNPQLIKDPLYFYSMDTKSYVSLDNRLYDAIVEGKVRL